LTTILARLAVYCKKRKKFIPPPEKVKFFMLEISDENLGTWIHQSSCTPAEFDIKVVEFAMKHGYDILRDMWEADKPVFLSGMATREMLDDLRIVADYSVGHLNELLPDNYYFDFDDAGLTLLKI
jgi:hypothetical protein